MKGSGATVVVVVRVVVAVEIGVVGLGGATVVIDAGDFVVVCSGCTD
jgi:hypothetical protein